MPPDFASRDNRRGGATLYLQGATGVATAEIGGTAMPEPPLHAG